MWWTLAAQKNHDEARVLLNKALKIEELVLGNWHRNTAETLSGLGANYRFMGQLEMALELAEKGLSIDRRIYAKDSSQIGPHIFQKGRTLLEMGRNVEALDDFMHVASITDAVHGQKHRNTLRVKTLWAWPLLPAARREEARTLLEETLQWQREVRFVLLTFRRPRRP